MPKYRKRKFFYEMSKIFNPTKRTEPDLFDFIVNGLGRPSNTCRRGESSSNENTQQQESLDDSCVIGSISSSANSTQEYHDIHTDEVNATQELTQEIYVSSKDDVMTSSPGLDDHPSKRVSHRHHAPTDILELGMHQRASKRESLTPSDSSNLSSGALSISFAQKSEASSFLMDDDNDDDNDDDDNMVISQHSLPSLEASPTSQEMENPPMFMPLVEYLDTDHYAEIIPTWSIHNRLLFCIQVRTCW